MESLIESPLCRLCLNNGDCLIYIFQEHPKQRYVPAKFIKDLLQIQITRGDEYPQFACLKCLDKLTEIRQFKKECLRSIVNYDKLLALKKRHQEEEKETQDPLSLVKVELDEGRSEVESNEDAFSVVEEKLEERSESIEYGVRVNECESGDVLEEEKPECVDGYSEDQIVEIECEPDKVLDQVKVECVEAVSDDQSEYVLGDTVWMPSAFLEKDCLEIVEHKSEDQPKEIAVPANPFPADRGGTQGGFQVPAIVGVNGRKKSVPREKKLTCEFCGKGFSHGGYFKKHLGTHTGNSPAKKTFQCADCNMVFQIKKNLRRHMRVHTGERPFECERCGKRFSWKKGLTSHLKTHPTTGDLYFCCICIRGFVEKKILRQHIRAHSDVGLFECRICNQTFTQMRTLRRHARIHSGDKPFSCQSCGLRFTHRASLRKHIAIHEAEGIHECHLCGGRFALKSSLSKHLRMHGENS